ncbi:uncharacterized protein LODBEIA_P57240 [Lodderomyces beijingensis]|uniref:JmjC domain-containing protein n=1 Tax=Lodderomyces beijingensis TaxID=1775926 RepID=A0ABP0ZI67_9ASCO
MSPAPRKKQKTGVNDYNGWAVPAGDVQVPTLDADDTTPKQFFDLYISSRKPVKLTSREGLVPLTKFKLDRLYETLQYGDEEDELQVERLHSGGFGSGQKRVKMKLSELMDKLKSGDGDYYLTTQYKESGDLEVDPVEQPDEEDEEDEEEEEEQEVDHFAETLSFDINNLRDDFDEGEDEEGGDTIAMDQDEAVERVSELYQRPLSNLAQSDILPLHPKIVPTLIPQQINLWMGKTQKSGNYKVDLTTPLTDLDKQIPSNGSSSGLHHDHADNLYILVQGRKRFTIFSPADAKKLYTWGNIARVYGNGVIDYKRDANAPEWMSIRDDGAIEEDVLRWQQGHNGDGQDELSVENTRVDSTHSLDGESLDPPSFSKIPPALLHLDEMDEATRQHVEAFASEHFPGVLQLNKMTVWLEQGEMLYLPAGWFHEVSSFGVEDNHAAGADVHIALNYWFIPPNKNEFEDPYRDDYWREDWQVTLQALGLLKSGGDEHEDAKD